MNGRVEINHAAGHNCQNFAREGGGGWLTTSCLFDCERHLVCHDTPNWQTLPGATRQGKQRVGVENQKGAEPEHRPIRKPTASNLR